MPKHAISVTLESENLLWLKGRAQAVQARGVSELLDALVTEARLGGRGAAPARSVVGTVDLAPDDPALERADDWVRGQFEASVRRPVLVREPSASYRHRAPRSKARRRG